MDTKEQLNTVLDKAGIWVAGICFIHCLVTPLVMIAMLSFGHAFLERWEMVDVVCCLLAPLIALFPLIAGYQRHRHVRGLLLFGFGFGLLTMGCTVYHDHDSVWHYVLMLTGAIAIIAAHLTNIYLQRNMMSLPSNNPKI